MVIFTSTAQQPSTKYHRCYADYFGAGDSDIIQPNVALRSKLAESGNCLSADDKALGRRRRTKLFVFRFVAATSNVFIVPQEGVTKHRGTSMRAHSADTRILFARGRDVTQTPAFLPTRWSRTDAILCARCQRFECRLGRGTMDH